MIARPSFQIVLERFLFLLLQGKAGYGGSAAGAATSHAESCVVLTYSGRSFSSKRRRKEGEKERKGPYKMETGRNDGRQANRFVPKQTQIRNGSFVTSCHLLFSSFTKAVLYLVKYSVQLDTKGLSLLLNL